MGGVRGICPQLPECTNVLISVAYPGFLVYRGTRDVGIFLWGHACQRGDKGHLAPLKNKKKLLTALAKSLNQKGTRGQGISWWGIWADVGCKGTCPYPLNIKTCADFSGVPRTFGLEGHT